MPAKPSRRRLLLSAPVLAAAALGCDVWRALPAAGHALYPAPLAPLAATAQSEPRIALPIVAVSGAGPAIGPVSTNLGDYAAGAVPLYSRLELTFTVATAARNLQLPYDDAPPPGVEPGIGVTVDALFTPDDWQTVYTQPAFYYQVYDHQVKSGRDWIYPAGDSVWKVRFSPTRQGVWQYRLRAADASGTYETPPQSFTVAGSERQGFIRVGAGDARYFEHDNGDFFLGLGYNLEFSHLDWNNPVVANEPRMQLWHDAGLQLFRFWLPQWGVYTSAWGAWDSPLPERHAQYIPATGLSMEQACPGSDVSMLLSWNWNPGMFLGFMKDSPAVKRHTRYRVSIRYLIPEPLQGPRLPGHPHGLVAKTGGWLTGPGSWPDNIYGFCDPGTGAVVSPYAVASPIDASGAPRWSTLEGDIDVGAQDFLPRLYLVLENVGDTAGGTKAFIDRVEIREDLGNGRYGPDIASSSWMARHLYMDQRNSYAFDRVLELAEQYGIYFKMVVLEKNEWTLNRIDYAGNLVPDDPGNNRFYGNWREMTKVRWLQQAWWRYLQARWGYSPHIHSWELLNEGDPWNGLHYTLADEFGRYMRRFAPNHHLVTTSFWHSFPRDNFWANPGYPHVDYADVHKYEESGVDTAESTRALSEQYGALAPGGAGKPLVRGETGFGDGVLQDTRGVWLHNYIWGLINPGGMYDLYWYSREHIEQRDNDLRHLYRSFRDFMAGIPLANGRYRDARAACSHPDLQAWGQVDEAAGRAHLWVRNRLHSWRNIVDGLPIPPLSGVVELAGLPPGAYRLEWWDTWAGAVARTESAAVAADGRLALRVDGLAADIAVRIALQPAAAAPAALPDASARQQPCPRGRPPSSLT